jgi:serine/threonine-protein kinase
MYTAAIERGQGRWEESTKHLEEAIALDPRNTTVLLELALENYVPLKRYDDAARIYDGVLSWKPDDFLFQIWRAYLDVEARADLSRLRSVVWGEAAKNADPELLADMRGSLAGYERDYSAAQKTLAESRDNKERLNAYLTLGMGDSEEAQKLLLEKHAVASANVAQKPHEPILLISLARTEAYLRRKDDAICNAERALELPASKSKTERPYLLTHLASIYTQVGEISRALDILENVVKLPKGPDYGHLKLAPDWDPLRGDPRFEKMVALLAPKESTRADVPEKSIAVLPFENRSEGKEDAFFANAIQDDVLTSLVKIKELKVIGRASTMSYRDGTNRNLRDIGRELGVAHVLEGTVRRVQDRMLIHVKLTDTRDGRTVWGERYDRTMADFTRLQGELAIEMARALEANLAPAEKTSLQAKVTENPDAYVLYLKARERERILATREDEIAADQLYAQAIAIDPTFALAHARASILNSGIYAITSDQARKVRAQTLAEQALRLSPALGEAHLARGLCLHRIDKNNEGALKELSIAAAALPNDPEVLDFSGLFYYNTGRWREALANFQRAQDLDPRNANLHVGLIYFQLRDWPAAAAAFQRVREMVPDKEHIIVASQIMHAYAEVCRTSDVAAGKAILRKIPGGLDPSAAVTQVKWYFSMLERDFVAAENILAEFPSEEFRGDPKFVYQGYTAFDRGDTSFAQSLFEKARPIFELRVRDHPDDAQFLAPLGKLYAYLGRKEDAIRASRRAVELTPDSKDAVAGPLHAMNLAAVYARTGEVDQALALIERLLWIPAGISLMDLRLGSDWDSLRSDPRFQRIVQGPEPKTIY